MARRIPSLDGLRAVSIAMVLLAHLQGTSGMPVRWLPLAWGTLGVTVFFVISGFLITSLLLKEVTRTGKISLRLFYFRRSMRIFPAMYVFLGAVLCLEWLGWLHLLPGDALAASTYTMNFRAVRGWWLGHTWSLAVEEQFYLAWPALLAGLGILSGTRVVLGAIIAAPVFRVVVFYGWPSLRPLVDQAFPLVFDSLATGCALAILRERLWGFSWYRSILESRCFVLVPVVVAVTYTSSPSVGLSLLVGQTVINVGAALIIDWGIRFPESRAGRVLNARLAVWVGTISYSLYLWQQLFLARQHPGSLTRFPVNLLLVFVAASASYYFVEQPCLRLRERLEHAWRQSSAARLTTTTGAAE
jgi:peptidoglycan/LPS O-acetylase OafA/YrhL